MPAFANPFQANVERKLTDEELIQAIRLDLAGELEAIYLYDAHVQATDNEIAKKVIADIRDEEKAHVGELMALLKKLDPQEAEWFASGESEVHEMLEDQGFLEEDETLPPSPKATVGSLLERSGKI
ncbi:MAG: ubiquinone biosynthesis protein COQ7 [Ruminococcaceae bacterium]|jgi:rubrerythrin|nr:ubiquinone biosynthesis protein COQ7 [Oscillospiraceae bacterium]HHV32671.1 ubiquinone biosynthesis protein COQ7 [Clostridiales bacterium]